MEVDIVKKCGEVLFAKARHKALYGGRGSGKSWSTATYLVAKAAESTKRIVCARQFQNSIRDSSKELIERRIRDLDLVDDFEVTAQTIKHKATGSEFVFVGLERNPQSFRSHEGVDIVWVEEARTISAKSLEILLPTIRNLNSEIIWTWNPEQPDDPVDKFFRGPNPPPPDMVAIDMVNHSDNRFFDRTSMPTEMELMRQNNPERYAHVWEGAYDTRYESKVFPNMITGRVEIPPNLAPLYGMDFGYTAPTFLVKVYVLEATKQIYVAAEASARRLSLDDLPDLIRMVVHDDSDVIMADSAEPKTIAFLNARGFRGVQKVDKAQDSVMAGLQFMQGYGLVVDPNCEETRNELRCYSWRIDPLTGQVRPGNPAPAFDHAADAIRYAISDLIANPALAEGDSGVIWGRMWKPTRETPEALLWPLERTRITQAK